ncbi:MAG: hypothetical protein BWX84_02615 [Verrucomicrobia bacterium ADurb.Bin118]|nr:MAG: hypothetical protein BWX84_02615 [Verrucomicrobia bacterium ADurb.Bin118]
MRNETVVGEGAGVGRGFASDRIQPVVALGVPASDRPIVRGITRPDPEVIVLKTGVGDVDVSHRQAGHPARHRPDKVGHNDIIQPRIGGAGRGQGAGGVDLARQILAVKTPLITGQRNPRGVDGKRDRYPRRNRKIAWLDDNLRSHKPRLRLPIRETVHMDARILRNEGRELHCHRSAGIRRVTIRKTEARVVAELVLVHGQIVIAHAQCCPPTLFGRIFPCHGENGHHIFGSGGEPLESDALGRTRGHVAAVNELRGHRRAVAENQSARVTDRVFREIRRREFPGHRGGGPGDPGEIDIVDRQIGPAAEVVSVGVEITGVHSGILVGDPLLHRPTAAARGNTEIIHQQGLVAGDIIHNRERLGLRRGGKFKGRIPIRRRPPDFGDRKPIRRHPGGPGQHDGHIVYVHFGVGLVGRGPVAPHVRAKSDFVSGPRHQAADGRAQRGEGAGIGGVGLDERHVVAIGNGAVVGKGGAPSGIQPHAFRGGAGPPGNGPVVSDVTGENRKRIRLETGIGNGLSPNRLTPKNRRHDTDSPQSDAEPEHRKN